MLCFRFVLGCGVFIVKFTERLTGSAARLVCLGFLVALGDEDIELAHEHFLGEAEHTRALLQILLTLHRVVDMGDRTENNVDYLCTGRWVVGRHVTHQHTRHKGYYILLVLGKILLHLA